MTAADAPALHGFAGEPARVGCVVIGRNEAPALRECLESVLLGCRDVVYVDSGSSDGSREIARSAGVRVHELDASMPFTAARARNEGFDWLRRRIGDSIDFVQFVDGDCRLEPGWLQAATSALQADPLLGVVAGRSLERSPQSSIYNRLCDIELDVPAGYAEECGGVAMIRARALEAAGGFDAALAAGEEPELCLRLRRLGWRIERLAVPMMRHDLAMDSLRQWWKRCMRSGRAYAESAWKHARGPERYRRREVIRILLWGGAVPLLTGAAAVSFGPPGLACLLGYAIPMAGAYRWARRRGRRRGESAVYASFCTAGKLPELCGIFQSCARLLRRRWWAATGLARGRPLGSPHPQAGGSHDQSAAE